MVTDHSFQIKIIQISLTISWSTNLTLLRVEVWGVSVTPLPRGILSTRASVENLSWGWPVS